MNTLIYDGDCAFCLRCVQWMQKHFKHVPQIVAWQQADLAQMGLTTEQCQTAVQWVSEDSNQILSAHKAVARVCKDAGGLIIVAGWLMSMPLVSQVAGIVYRWVARNRQKMPGGTAACAIDFEKKS
jgi:predicted DCC family thiol-disulfide oxidoreductase YuxK